MKILGNVIGLTVVGGLLSGCMTMPYQPYARSVKMLPSKGGVVALKPEHKDEDRLAAEGIMRKTCGDTSFKVLEEGEVAVGTVTTSDAMQKEEHRSKIGSVFGIPLVQGEDGQRTTTQSATTTQKEWQISYTCLAANKSGRSKAL